MSDALFATVADVRDLPLLVLVEVKVRAPAWVGWINFLLASDAMCRELTCFAHWCCGNSQRCSKLAPQPPHVWCSISSASFILLAPNTIDETCHPYRNNSLRIWPLHLRLQSNISKCLSQIQDLCKMSRCNVLTDCCGRYYDYHLHMDYKAVKDYSSLDCLLHPLD